MQNVTVNKPEVTVSRKKKIGSGEKSSGELILWQKVMSKWL